MAQLQPCLINCWEMALVKYWQVEGKMAQFAFGLLVLVANVVSLL